MYNYYKIDQIPSLHAGQMNIRVHDYQSKKYATVVVGVENNSVFLLLEDGTKYRVIGISREFPTASFRLEGQPVVLLSGGDIDFMANRALEIKDVSEICYCYKDAEGEIIHQPYLDSWLITEKSIMNTEKISEM